MKLIRRLAFLLASLLLATEVRAQPAEGAVVSGIVGIAAANSNTDFVISASAGYRFNRVFGMGVELTSVPSLSGDPDFLLYAPFDSSDANGSMTIFTTNIRLEVPTTSPRVVPYAVAGGGVANVKERVDVILVGFDVAPPVASSTPPIYPSPAFDDLFLYSTINLALTAGAGVSILAGGHVSIDVDVRYLRLIGDEDRNIGRFGGGVSYRF